MFDVGMDRVLEDIALSFLSYLQCLIRLFCLQYCSLQSDLSFINRLSECWKCNKWCLLLCFYVILSHHLYPHLVF